MQGIKAKSKSASPLIRIEEELNLAKRDSQERAANFALRFITALLTHLYAPQRMLARPASYNINYFISCDRTSLLVLFTDRSIKTSRSCHAADSND